MQQQDDHEKDNSKYNNRTIMKKEDRKGMSRW